MATEKPRFTVTLSEELLGRVEDYRHEHKISTRSKAVVELLEIGIDELLADVKNPASDTSPHYSGRAAQVAEAFDRADERTKTIVELNLEPYMDKKDSKKTG